MDDGCYVKPMSARNLAVITSTELDDVTKMAHFAAYSTWRDNKLRWATVDECLDEEWPIVQACADAAMRVTGMLDEGDHLELVTGNSEAIQ